MSTIFLRSKRLTLRPFNQSDITKNYIGWLNDPEVNRFSQRRLFPTNDVQAQNYLQNRQKTEAILAICIANTGQHIGNIKFGPISWIHRGAELSIVIGQKDSWGLGYAKEAIYTVTKHLFEQIGLHRVYAASVNPAFIQCVRKLGWQVEGTNRQAYFLSGRYVDVQMVAMLQTNFIVQEQYHP